MFFVFEGIDGSGKGTQLDLFAEFLRNRLHQEPVILRDPGTTEVGLGIRKLLLDKTLPMSPLIQTMLFTTARATLVEHIFEVKQRQPDAIFLSDRWLLSTLVYQCEMGSVSHDLVYDMHQQFCRGLQPLAYVVLDVPAEEAAERKLTALRIAGQEDRFESYDTEWHKRLRGAYLRLREKLGHDNHTALLFSGLGDPQDVSKKIIHELIDRCPALASRLAKRHVL